MRRLTNPRSLAKAIRATVEAEDRWNQQVWLSAAWFEADQFGEMQASGTKLRELLTRNVCGTKACVAGHASS